jgi:Kef-type K+ transport system membrane component KefB/Trk K+ transport system NAD-binding subunit
MITFTELTIIFGFAFLSALIFRILKQPIIISYIFTGIILSQIFLTSPQTKPLIELFSDLGVAFLLFIVGLELKLKTLREIGVPSLIIGFLQEFLTILAGFFILKYFLGFSTLVSLYLSIALSFSSTIIVLKLITDKGDLEKLYGKLSVGFLLVQDLIAILILFLLPFFVKGLNLLEGENFLNIILGILAIFLIPFLSQKFLPKIENFLEKSTEFLFLFSLSFGLGIASLFKYLGFGLEAGALIAGVSLSSLSSNYEIASRLRPLRDFFLILFFILIGSKIILTNFQNFLDIIILSLFVLIGNPLIMLLMLNPLGYSSKTSFLLGLTSAQISEFSFVLINQGVKLGHLSQDILSLTGIVGLITIFFSTYLFVYAEKIYNLLYPILKIFERKKIKEEKEEIKTYDYFLFGCDRVGYSFLKFFEKDKLLIIDYNPDTIKKLKNEGFNVLYGDAEEIEFLETLNFSGAKIVISTIPDLETNLIILKEAKPTNQNVARFGASSTNQGPIFIAVSNRIEDALELYKNGADFVILPHFLGGEYAVHLIKEYGFDKEKYLELKEKEINHLNLRLKLGHRHPK